MTNRQLITQHRAAMRAVALHAFLHAQTLAECSRVAHRLGVPGALPEWARAVMRYEMAQTILLACEQAVGEATVGPLSEPLARARRRITIVRRTP